MPKKHQRSTQASPPQASHRVNDPPKPPDRNKPVRSAGTGGNGARKKAPAGKAPRKRAPSPAKEVTPVTSKPAAASGGGGQSAPGSGAASKGKEVRVHNPNRVFRRRHRVSPTQLTVMQERFPDWTFDFGNGDRHPHPLGATERAICETLALERLQELHPGCNVTDIGGNANRHAANGRTHVHSCNPILSSDDVLRRSEYHPDARYCSKAAADCELVPDTYLSVHSLYYIHPNDVVELVHRSRKRCLVAVVHRFDNLYGTMHFNGDEVESHYEAFVHGNDIHVNMRVRGNATSYSHDSCAWLNTTYHEYYGKAVCWNGKQVGDSWIYTFRPVPLELVGKIHRDTNRPMSLVESLRRNDHYGSVSGILSHGDESTYKPMLEVLNFKFQTIRSFGGFMWLTKPREQPVLLPKNIVQRVAVEMVGVERDKAGLRKCMSIMRNTVNTERMSVPDSMKLNCIIHGSALAFVYALNDEITVFNNLCSPSYKRLYRNLKSVLALEEVDFCSWFCWGGSSLGDDVADHPTVRGYRDERRSYGGHPPFDAKLAFEGGWPGTESNMPSQKIRPGAKIAHETREKCEDRPQFHPVCQTFQECIPVVPYSSPNNETAGLRARVLAEVPSESNEAWDKLEAFALPHITAIFRRVPNHDLDGDFHKWNANFPKGRQKNQLAAWEDLQVKPLTSKDFTRKSFVKRELTMKGGPVAGDLKPRIIQGNCDRLNVAGGPFLHAVAKQLKSAWRADTVIFFTSGSNAEEIGAWRAQFGDEPVTIWESDQRCYDCHQQERAYRFFDRILKRCGSDEYGYMRIANKSMEIIFGWTTNGIRYKVNYGMTSGQWSTTTCNSFINGIMTLFVFVTLWEEGVDLDFRIIVHGDDNLVVNRGRLSLETKRLIKTRWTQICLSYGFTVAIKSTHEWSQAEYCSSLFWPVKDGYVLGPKVGKRLPKIGFSLRKLDQSETKGMLLGLRAECSFVPVLRTYAKHQLKLLSGVAKKKWEDHRAVYKSLCSETHAPCDQTFQFFRDRYGISVEEAETQLRSVLTNNLTDCVSYDLLELFKNKDL